MVYFTHSFTPPILPHSFGSEVDLIGRVEATVVGLLASTAPYVCIVSPMQ